MGLSKPDKEKYSRLIENNIKKLENITPEDFYIPIKQVAYRFNLDNNDMYLDYPYSDIIEQQNIDLKSTYSQIFNIDNKIFDYLNVDTNNDLNYILYQYEYLNDKEPIIRNIASTISDFKEKTKFEVIRKAFSIIYYNATGIGNYLDGVKYEEINSEEENYKGLLFVFEKFEVNVVLAKEKKLSYLNVTFELNHVNNKRILHELKFQKVIKHLCYDLEIFGETLLNKPLSDALAQAEFRKIYTQNVEEYRHSLLNLINTISHKVETITDLHLRNGLEFIFKISQDLATEEKDKPDLWKNYDEEPYLILQKVIDFFQHNESSILNLEYFPKGTTSITLTPIQKYAYLTIMFNLVHNAYKAWCYYGMYNGEKEYIVELIQTKESVVTKITTPSLIDNNVVNYINDLFPIEFSGLNKFGGIVISKELAQKHNWNFRILVDSRKKENTMILKIG